MVFAVDVYVCMFVCVFFFGRVNMTTTKKENNRRAPTTTGKWLHVCVCVYVCVCVHVPKRFLLLLKTSWARNGLFFSSLLLLLFLPPPPSLSHMHTHTHINTHTHTDTDHSTPSLHFTSHRILFFISQTNKHTHTHTHTHTHILCIAVGGRLLQDTLSFLLACVCVCVCVCVNE
jgi:hypothetical protein